MLLHPLMGAEFQICYLNIYPLYATQNKYECLYNITSAKVLNYPYIFERFFLFFTDGISGESTYYIERKQ